LLCTQESAALRKDRTARLAEEFLEYSREKVHFREDDGWFRHLIEEKRGICAFVIGKGTHGSGRGEDPWARGCQGGKRRAGSTTKRQSRW
jgi:hypothetical protein